MRSLVLLLILLSTSLTTTRVLAQSASQSVSGRVRDAKTLEPIEYAVIASSGKAGAKSDSTGYFSFELPYGRYSLRVTSGGYDTYLIRELLVTSSKSITLDILLEPTEGELIVVSDEMEARIREVGARTFTVEQTSRIAGGFDDPARYATAFAGVTSGVANNAIIVRGNSPTAIQWRLNGVEVPNPNHFAELTSFGGGGLTALSTQVLANSKFLIGALPSLYQNALAGAFDIEMRKGNTERNEHTFQLGAIGIDAASEGPLGLGDGSSYLFNYRYSTLTLLEPLLPEEAAGTTFQDLAFRLHVPQGNNTISLWGFGLTDGSGQDPERDSAQWTYPADLEQQDAKQTTYATGLSYDVVSGSTVIKSTLAYTQRSMDLETGKLINNNVLPWERVKTRQGDLSLTSHAVSALSESVYLNYGARATQMGFNLDLAVADSAHTMTPVVDRTGSALLANAHAGLEFNFSDLKIEAGLATQYLDLNEDLSLEPRISLTYQLDAANAIGLAYGLHSRMERLNYYFVQTGDILPNTLLDLAKAHHVVAQYKASIGENISLEVSPYYQHLVGLPIVAGTPEAIINVANDWFFDKPLVNEGVGKNYGIDLTLERPLANGYYFLLSGSLFKSEYRGGDNVWRSTRYDRIGAVNAILGTEWALDDAGKQLLSISVRGTYQGGLRETPLDIQASNATNTIVLDSANAFTRILPSQAIAHFNASWRFNAEGHSWLIAFGVLNLTGAKEFLGYRRNLKTGEIEDEWDQLVIPNLSFKLEF